MARRSGGSRGGRGKTTIRTTFTPTFKMGGNNAKRTAKRGNGKRR